MRKTFNAPIGWLKAAPPQALAWTVTVLMLVVDTVWLLLAGWSVSARQVAVIALAATAFLAPLAIPRYRGDRRIRSAALAAALFTVMLAAGATLSYLVISTNAALVDAPLAAWDKTLGFDWLALHDTLQHHPIAQTTLHLAYQSGLVQLVLVIPFLAFGTHFEQLDEFMHLFIVATLLTIVVSGLFPAAGVWKYQSPAGPFDLSTLSHFEPLRDGRMREIPLGRMQGLVSMPSMHAATAVLFIHAMRGTRIWPAFVVVNLAMLLSTPIDGGHYLVDVLAGVAMAIGLIALERRRSARPLAAASIVPGAKLGAAH